MASPPFNLDITDPTDTSFGSAFPANERAFRDNVNSYLNTEHDYYTGYHKFQVLTTAQRSALSLPPKGMLVFTTDANPVGLYINTGTSVSPIWTATFVTPASYGIHSDFITASGSYTIPATRLKIYAIGAGGGAAGSNISPGPAGNGGSGAYLIKLLSGLTVGNTLTITIGTAGVGGGSGTSPGGPGSSTIVASGTQSIGTLTAPGGGGGGNNVQGVGAAIATGGDINSIGNGGIYVGGGLIGPFGSSFGTGGLVNTNLYGGTPGTGAPGLVVVDWVG